MTTPPVISIVVPCYNEQETLTNTNNVLCGLLDRLIQNNDIAPNSGILYVNDGSTDKTWNLICSFSDQFPKVEGISLAANSGHQNALIAGLEEVAFNCQAAISIDADLQDDVNAIAEMIEKFKNGDDIVMGVRKDRKADSWFKRETAQSFYQLQNKLGVKSIYNHADFRLMSRRAILSFLQYGERNMFIRGIVAGLGFNQSTVEYDRKSRTAGISKYPLKKMVNFAIDGITSFTVKPVRLISIVGISFLLVDLIIFIYSIIRYMSGHTIEGWTSTILSIWFCSGVILLSLGVMGEYIGKIYTEVKQRPRYIIKDRTYNPGSNEQ